MEFIKPYLYSESELTDEMKDDAVEHNAAKFLDIQKKYFVFNNDINTFKWCNRNKVDYRNFGVFRAFLLVLGRIKKPMFQVLTDLTMALIFIYLAIAYLTVNK